VTRVLVIDDEPQILRALRINLRARRYEVGVAATGSEALELAAAHPPDLVILDLGLPDMDGIDVIGGLRGWTAVPIIVLSGRADSTDKVEALDAGADDYVTKPFGMDELLARMRAAVRRTPAAEAPPLVRLGDLTVDFAAKRVTRDGGTPTTGHGPRGLGRGPETGRTETGRTETGRTETERPEGERPDGGIRLTPTEWHLLEVLLRNPGKLLSQRQLLHDVWGPGYDKAGGNLRLYMAQLRRKLEPDPARPRWLITEPGMGYRYQPPDASEPPEHPEAGEGLGTSGTSRGMIPGSRVSAELAEKLGDGRDRT
jgi:two-component system, OmpR family, KDP operon response regulator KdpE